MTDKIELSSTTYVISSVTLRHILDENSEPWFVAKDVCDYLEINNVSNAYSRIDDEDKGVHLVDTPGGRQEMVTVNEPGLYQLIFASNKPEAKAFKRWVFHDLLPTLRRTGSYKLPGYHLPDGSGKATGYGSQPLLSEMKRRGLTHREMLRRMNAVELENVPKIKMSNFGNQVYGGTRIKPAFARRAMEVLSMTYDELFTAPVASRDAVEYEKA